MIIFSSSSISSMGRSAFKKARTVVETSSASVHSGMAVATIYRRMFMNLTRYSSWIYLVNELAAMEIFWHKDLCPELRCAPFHQIASLLFEHGVGICDREKPVVAESFRVCNVRQVWVACLAEFSHHERFVDLHKGIALSFVHINTKE